jgi:hypothetical protein
MDKVQKLSNPGWYLFILLNINLIYTKHILWAEGVWNLFASVVDAVGMVLLNINLIFKIKGSSEVIVLVSLLFLLSGPVRL